MDGDVDSVLLDRVFQPVTDRLAEWVSCFGLARVALAAAVGAQAAALLYDVQLDTDPFQVTFSTAMAGLTVYGAQQAWALIRRIERQSRPGSMNLRRITLRRRRLVWLGVCSCSIAVALPRGDLGSDAAALACAAWIALVYFVSCSPAQPMRRYSPLLAGAFG